MSEPSRRRRKRNKNAIPFILLILVLCCLVGGAASVLFFPAQAVKSYGSPSESLNAFQRWQYSFRLVTSGESLRFPFNAGSSRALFEISPAESVPSISTRLVDMNFIQSADLFNTYLIYKGYDRCLRSGEYYLSGSMTAMDIAEKLCVSAGDRTEFSILPGWRAEEIAKSLESYGFQFSGEEFLKTVQNPEKIDGLPKPYATFPSLEGFLFPTGYPLDRDVTVDNFVLTMVDEFDGKITNKMRKGFEKQGLSLYEAVILASIVEREAVSDAEKPVIASVFYNRLKAGMRLETDPTVQYALGYQKKNKSWWKVPLSLADLQVDSPFNTYMVNGLPPAPISNPGIDSLMAVAFPDDTNYYYFRSACDGTGRHNFSETLDEHLSNACPE